MHTRNRQDRGRLITISVAALFAMLVIGAASAEAAGHPAAYTRSFSRVTKLSGAKLVSVRIASAPARAGANRIESVAKSLRQAASDSDYALVAFCLLFEISLVVFAWRIPLPVLIAIPARLNGPRASRAPPSF